jgi:hypothetical protein
VVDVVVQEQNIETGEVTFEWSALDHVPIDETQVSLGNGPVDYVHINSLDYDDDGNLLLSARHTSTVYKVDAASGDIMWRFGGENSDFTFADAADMPSYQHDARRLPDGRLSVFDNGNTRSPQFSRGAVYEIDEQAMTASLAQDLQPETRTFATFTGSTRQAANGNQLVAYGDTGRLVEFSGTEPVFTATFTDAVFTYRAERATDWVGTPATAPDVAWSEQAGDGSRELHMSWNGATEVDSWRIETGEAPGGESRLTTLATVERTGFETDAEVTAPDGSEAYRVSALDADGDVLGARTLTEGVTPTLSGSE